MLPRLLTRHWARSAHRRHPTRTTLRIPTMTQSRIALSDVVFLVEGSVVRHQTT
ncbi:MAG: hypothetical protein GY715_06345 [Planctomycetes bacterium]|nr:hypothetical protein [Planctomycetota bacterium]